MEEQKVIRVLIVDDHPVVREGIRSLLCGEPDVLVVGEASTGAEALELYRELEPDVMLLDLRLPDGNGTDVLVALLEERPSARVLIVSSLERAGDIRSALDAGARGYLIKDAIDEEILAGLRAVAVGAMFVSKSATARLVDSMALGRLTAREREVLELMVDGLANNDISRRLGWSVGTVKSYVHTILGKLSVKTRAEAVAFATKRGLVRPR